MSKIRCTICGKEEEWGNNPEPLFPISKGRVCKECNYEFVIPARLAGTDEQKQQKVFDALFNKMVLCGTVKNLISTKLTKEEGNNKTYSYIVDF